MHVAASDSAGTDPVTSARRLFVQMSQSSLCLPPDGLPTSRWRLVSGRSSTAAEPQLQLTERKQGLQIIRTLVILVIVIGTCSVVALHILLLCSYICLFTTLLVSKT